MRNYLPYLLVFCLAAVAYSQEEAGEVAEKVQDVYDDKQGLEIDFVQVMTSGTSGKSLEESGVVALKKPGRMKWEYKVPDFKLYIADGENVYFYVPADNQVTTMDLDNANQEQTHILFLMGTGDILRDFAVSYETYEEPLHPGSIMLRLVPNTEQDYDFLVLEVNPRDYYVERLMSFDPLGNITEFIFSNFREKLYDNAYFEFSIPEKVEVVRMDEVQ